MFWFAILGVVVLAWIVLVILFTPAIDYHLRERVPTGTADFLRMLRARSARPPSTAATGSRSHQRPRLLSGDDRRDPPGRAQRQPRVLHLPPRQASPTSSSTRWSTAPATASPSRSSPMRSAACGCSATGRQAARGRLPRQHVSGDASWYSLARLNNRTHRELLVIDGKIAFIGGAGVADWWHTTTRDGRTGATRWCASKARRSPSIQGVFAENWLECCGEILTGDALLPAARRRWKPKRSRRRHRTRAAPTRATPPAPPRSSSRARRRIAPPSRVVFQSLIEGSRHTLPHQHAVFPARQTAASGALPRGAARRRHAIIVPGIGHRSAVGAPRQPPHLRQPAGGRRAACSNTGPR